MTPSSLLGSSARRARGSPVNSLVVHEDQGVSRRSGARASAPAGIVATAVGVRVTWLHGLGDARGGLIRHREGRTRSWRRLRGECGALASYETVVPIANVRQAARAQTTNTIPSRRSGAWLRSCTRDPAAGRRKCVVRQAHEVQAMPAVVGDLDERAVVIGLDHRADGPGRPATGVSHQLDDVEDAVSTRGHHAGLSQGLMGCRPRW